MKNSYYERLDNRHLACLDIVSIDFRLEAYEPHDVRYVITRINVPASWREKGVATRMFTNCCADADEENARCG